MVTVGAVVALFGALGAAALLAVLALGGVIGWQVHKLYVREERRTVSPPDRRETDRERRAREDQEAFGRLMSYSADDAYGLREGDDA